MILILNTINNNMSIIIDYQYTKNKYFNDKNIYSKLVFEEKTKCIELCFSNNNTQYNILSKFIFNFKHEDFFNIIKDRKIKYIKYINNISNILII